MKATKPEKLSIIIMLALVSFISIFIFSIITKAGNAENSIRVTIQKLESFSGQSEFYYRPAGDTRIWHVINSYSGFDPDDNMSQNMSYYKFNSDSVLIINHYAGVQNQNQPNVTLNDFALIANKFNNK